MGDNSHRDRYIDELKTFLLSNSLYYDAGSQYDAAGNLKDWWGNETLQKFKKKTTCMAGQYSNYTENGYNVRLQAYKNVLTVSKLTKHLEVVDVRGSNPSNYLFVTSVVFDFSGVAPF